MLQCVAVRRSALQYVAVCCRLLLQYVAVCCRLSLVNCLYSITAALTFEKCVAMSCDMLQCVAVCCSATQHTLFDHCSADFREMLLQTGVYKEPFGYKPPTVKVASSINGPAPGE